MSFRSSVNQDCHNRNVVEQFLGGSDSDFVHHADVRVGVFFSKPILAATKVIV